MKKKKTIITEEVKPRENGNITQLFNRFFPNSNLHSHKNQRQKTFDCLEKSK